MSTDPLDVLRSDDVPVTPNRAFASALRSRLADALGLPPTPGAAMSDTATTTTTLTANRQLRPYLTLIGADAAIEFYAEAFGAVVVGGLFRDADGRVGHAELDIDGTGFYLADAYPEYGNIAPDPSAGHSVALHLEVADTDATVGRAVAAGATVVRPAEDQAYGARSATLLDPFGHRWSLMGPLPTPMSDEEVRRAMADQGVDFETVDLGERAAPPVAAAPRPVHGLGYFTLNVPDGARAAAFYGALLGWTPEPGSQPDGFHVSNIDPPGGIAGGQSTPGTSLYLRVDDLAAAVERVRELGGQVLTEGSYASGGDAECMDDQGVPFHLWSPAAGYR